MQVKAHWPCTVVVFSHSAMYDALCRQIAVHPSIARGVSGLHCHRLQSYKSLFTSATLVTFTHQVTFTHFPASTRFVADAKCPP